LCPKTVENFRTLVTGEKGVNKDGVKLHLKGTKIHRVVRKDRKRFYHQSLNVDIDGVGEGYDMPGRRPVEWGWELV